MRLHDCLFLLGTGACWALKKNWPEVLNHLVWKGRLVRRLNSRDLAPNPVAGLPFVWPSEFFGTQFSFHIYLQQWVLISYGSPSTTLIWVKFAGSTHKSIWALTFVKKISISFVSIACIKMPSTNFFISDILGKMKGNSKILNNMIHIPVIKNN